MLDYDGTLVGYAKRPQDAAPPADLIKLLTELARLPMTTTAIVSGRSSADLETWFGGVEGLWLAAEHGAVVRPPGQAAWENSYAGYSPDWKKNVYPFLEHYVDCTPGSFVEEKEFSLVWHYRMADPEFGKWLANELAHDLEQMLADTPLRAVRGQKTVEVKLMWANKGEVFNRLTIESPEPDFPSRRATTRPTKTSSRACPRRRGRFTSARIIRERDTVFPAQSSSAVCSAVSSSRATLLRRVTWITPPPTRSLSRHTRSRLTGTRKVTSI